MIELFERYASAKMLALFSRDKKYTNWRLLWLSLASNQQKLGLDISDEQIKEMKENITSFDWAKIASYEKEMRHEVMAHARAFGDLCPKARPIIHLGATSAFVMDNGDLLGMREALALVGQKLHLILTESATLAKKYAALPCLGYTHFQSAQPTTVGKRIALWLQDLLEDHKELFSLNIPFRGVKGATGTQSSYKELLGQEKAFKLDEFVAKDFGFSSSVPLSSQTYSRKVDLQIFQRLASFAATCHKIGTDLRLLAHEGEIYEPFAKKQVGSSAMPYKRNPMLSERLCGLSRYVMNLAQNGEQTFSTQWLERSLDDSSNRRLTVPQIFLATDSLLNLLYTILPHLDVHEKTISVNLEKDIPFLVTEPILMEAVKSGKDRAKTHRLLQEKCQAALHSNLYQEIANDPEIGVSLDKIKKLAEPKNLTGCAEAQVVSFLENELMPYLSKHKEDAPGIPKVEV